MCRSGSSVLGQWHLPLPKGHLLAFLTFSNKEADDLELIHAVIHFSTRRGRPSSWPSLTDDTLSHREAEQLASRLPAEGAAWAWCLPGWPQSPSDSGLSVLLSQGRPPPPGGSLCRARPYPCTLC